MNEFLIEVDGETVHVSRRDGAILGWIGCYLERPGCWAEKNAAGAPREDFEGLQDALEWLGEATP